MNGVQIASTSKSMAMTSVWKEEEAKMKKSEWGIVRGWQGDWDLRKRAEK